MTPSEAQHGSPSSRRARALVVGVSGTPRRRAEALLDTAGITLARRAERPVDLVVVLTAGNASERISAIRAVAAEHDGAHILVVVSPESTNAMLRRALVAGATGLLLEPDVDRALGASAQALLAGQLAVPSALSRQIAPRPLSHREKEVLGLVAAGCTNLEIAKRLFLSESTVKTHLSSAFRKVDARSRAEAVARLQDPEIGQPLGVPSQSWLAKLAAAG